MWRATGRSSGSKNLNHALFHLQRTIKEHEPIVPETPKDVNNCLFTCNGVRDARPLPLVTGPNSISLKNNMPLAIIKSPFKRNTIMGLLGEPWSIFRKNVSSEYQIEACRRVIKLINVPNPDLGLSQYDHSIPCAIFLALIAQNESETTALQALHQLETTSLDREVPELNMSFTIDHDFYPGQAAQLLKNQGFEMI